MRFEDFARTIVVPCAGRAERLGAQNLKCLTNISGAPLLRHAIAPFRENCERWVFIAPPENDSLHNFILNENLSAEIIIQPEPLGLADAALRAEAAAGECFMLLLGDCIIRGDFGGAPDLETAIGVWPGAAEKDTGENYGVELGGGLVARAIEKPAAASGLLCGMGVYFLSSEFMEFLNAKNSASGGALHFTSALSLWAQTTHKLSALLFDGYYKNINTSENLAEATAFLDTAPMA